MAPVKIKLTDYHYQWAASSGAQSNDTAERERVRHPSRDLREVEYVGFPGSNLHNLEGSSAEQSETTRTARERNATGFFDGKVLTVFPMTIPIRGPRQ